VLFDVFDDGARVLGGAPFNVAWHLKGFGLEPLFLTRIGDDDDGRVVAEAMRDWDMDRRGLQVDSQAATGVVHVDDRSGEPTYDIVPGRAYDRLNAEAAFEALGSAVDLLLYHGTLAARFEPSRSTIRDLRRRTGLPIFVDVNLRDPWWNPEDVSELIADATWIKLNEDELGRLAPTIAAMDDTAGVEPTTTAAKLRSAIGARQVIVTRGERGALVEADDGVEQARPKLTGKVVDTVGAGDAFSAVWILGLAHRWPAATTLDRALAFAARICSIRGATSDDRSLYREIMAAWDRQADDPNQPAEPGEVRGRP
jgi:fructokinase